ncbi:MAG: Rid family detoxifying hydrolase [Acidimicrobiia bacterium]
MAVQPLPTPSAPPAAGPYSPAVRAGDWIVLAGQLGVDPSTGELVGPVDAQARQALVNVEAILRDCGASLEDVAKTTVFVTDLGDWATVNRIYAETFGDHKPARATVQIAALPLGGAVEIEVWAHRPPR